MEPSPLAAPTGKYATGADTAAPETAHPNFVEYVPIITLMVALLEMSGLPAMQVHLLMGALLVSRLLHPLGMYAAPNTLQFRIGRVGGITITLILLIACAAMILWRAWLAS